MCVFSLITAYMIYFLASDLGTCKFAMSMVVSVLSAIVTSIILWLVYMVIGICAIRKTYEKMYRRVLEQTRDTEGVLDHGRPKMRRLVKVRLEGDEESHWTDEKSLISV